MFISARKKAILAGIIGILILGAGLFSWQVKKGNLFSKAATLATGEFSDVSADYWAYNYIKAAALGGIVNGYGDGTFKPDAVVTRDQMAVFLARALAGGDDKISMPGGTVKPVAYSDVPSTYWAYKYILYIKSKGIAQGYSDGKYHPEYEVTRDQMAVFLSRAIAGSDSAVPAGPATATFKDVPTNFWAYKYIEYLVANNYASGYADGNYRPTEKVSRAQMAAYISKGWDLISTTLVANVSGKITTNTGAPLPNAFVVLNDAEEIVQADANGNFSFTKLDATTYEISIYDKDGNLYESPDVSDSNSLGTIHLMSLKYGNQTYNLNGLIKK